MAAKKIIISGGGTGGHIYPAVAIANELREIHPDIELLFVGAEGKMEMEKVPKAGYEIIGLPIAGINRSNVFSNIGFPFKLINSLRKAHKIIKEFKPDAVVGVGGYASGPTLIAAGWMGVPTLIQEQNSFAGLTNKFLSKKAKKICVAYSGMEQFFSADKIRLTGNPVRSDIAKQTVAKLAALEHFNLSPDRKTVLIIGGSQGARSINEAIAKDIKLLITNNIQLIWQTGTTFIDKAREAIAHFPCNRVVVSEFIYEMPYAYAAADVVASRAGALSVSEICLVGKPAILVPFPHAAEDHQTQNAMSLVNSGAAWMVEDKNAGAELAATILKLCGDETSRTDLSKNCKKLAKPNAGKEIAEEVLKICK